MSGAAYDQLYLHRLMVQDRIRVERFKDALSLAVHPGDVVLDVGTGSGILALLASRAGARNVYAVEPTPMAEIAGRMIKDNGLTDRITVIQSALGAVSLPERADVIVFEWMGAHGDDENLFQVFLEARDKWLKPGGRMIPERVDSWLAPAFDQGLDRDRKFFAERPFGLSLDHMWEKASEELHYARHDLLQESVLATPIRFDTYDAYQGTIEKARSPHRWAGTFVATQDGKVNCLAGWFDAHLFGPIVLSNAPGESPTHWGRVAFPLRHTYQLHAGEKMEVTFTSEPVQPGWCRGGWSFRIDGGQWEHHLDHRKI